MSTTDGRVLIQSNRMDSAKKGISLKQLAEEIGLSPGTISVVLNDTPRANTIPLKTKLRIIEAAEKFNYRPHYFARSLRANQSFTIGVLVSELTGGYCAMVLNGLEEALTSAGYFYLVTSHFHREDLLLQNPRLLVERQVDGLVTIDTGIRFDTDLPVVAVGGHEEIDGVDNVVLNHETAAELGIRHLYSLGHRRIAFLRGQDFSADTQIRWETITAAAKAYGIEIDTALVGQLGNEIGTPEAGYLATKKLLSGGKKPFTALFAFNDVSAIGAIRAIQEMGLRVPEDVSVLGFDDVVAAEFHNPALTTIRQPLFEMGKLAGETLLKKIRGIDELTAGEEAVLTVEPELIVRSSTGPVLDS